MDSKNVKIVVFVPETHTDIVREAMGKAGAGKKGADPHIGKVGKFEEVIEERIEAVCPREKLQEVIKAIKSVHRTKKSHLMCIR